MKSKKKHILVVEDDPAIANGLKNLLQSENYAVVVCRDGESGLRKILAASPDLVLLDIGLPKLTGFAVLQRLHEEGFEKPIIMLTSSSMEVDKVRAYELGALGYVEKPFSSVVLLAEIRRRLQSAPLHTQHGRIHRLLAIMFTDIEEYSKKMNLDESLTMGLLKIHNDLVADTVVNHGGTIVEDHGDSFVISFETVTDAVQCGIAIQQRFKAYRHSKSKAQHIHVRIGIHVGDVTTFDGKLKGDAINLAARVQQIAEPDCVYISESVFDNIKNKINLKVVDLGKRRVKNIKKPIRVYQVSV